MLERGLRAAALALPLNVLDGPRDLRGDGGQQIEFLVGRMPPRLRLIDREDAEKMPVRVREGDHQPVLRVPVLRVRRRLLVPRLPERPLARGTQQLLDAIASVHRHHLEVVPGGPVEVDDDRAPAKAVGDRFGDRVERLLELALPVHERRDVEQRHEPGGRAVVA